MSALEKLLDVMATLRNPDGGCPWDLEQNFKTIAPYTIEEAYEVADAIDRENLSDLKEELGDLLLQVVFHAQIASEEKHFTFEDVAMTVADKMIARHPHVFSDHEANTVSDVNALWEDRKDSEKSSKSAIDGVTKGLPALLRAQKLQKRAARARFEWKTADTAFNKLEEELHEFKDALQNGTKEQKQDELGDVLFCIVNYARMLDLDSEEALRQTNTKFENRFKGMESDLKSNNLTMQSAPLDQMLEYWEKQKRKE